MAAAQHINVSTYQRIIALTLVSASWASALLLLLGDNTAGRIGAGVFLAFKGATIVFTLMAMARNRRLAWQVFCSRYRFSPHLRRGLTQAITRFTWELPQFSLSYMIAQVRVLCGNVDRVDTLEGVTYVTCCHRKEHAYTGMSLGCFVQMWLPVEIQTDFEHYARHYAGKMLLHEYGHTIDSQLWGWLYLPIVGIPSLLSQWLELLAPKWHRHEKLYAERWANRHASKLFENS